MLQCAGVRHDIYIFLCTYYLNKFDIIRVYVFRTSHYFFLCIIVLRAVFLSNLSKKSIGESDM